MLTKKQPLTPQLLLIITCFLLLSTRAEEEKNENSLLKLTEFFVNLGELETTTTDEQDKSVEIAPLTEISETTTTSLDIQRNCRTPKAYTVVIYMAADNDLSPFARRNLKQLTDIGSSSHVNILVQLDTRVAGNRKITKRYYIEKGSLVVTNQNDPTSQQMDSGSPYTLIDCCKWAITNYPAKRYVLVLWNHGLGPLDIGTRKSINPSRLFSYSIDSHLLELDRSIPFLDYVQAVYDRAICFDDSTGHYLSNQDLEMALATIARQFLKGEKWSHICFDACLMQAIEIANIIKHYAEYMIASQEVELGTGYDYQQVFLPLTQRPLNEYDFAQHVVNAYGNAYTAITGDFTQSAIDLRCIDAIERNVNDVAALLLHCLSNQKKATVFEAIKVSKHKLFCTHFDEPSYKDLYNLYENFLINIKKFELTTKDEAKIKSKLSALLREGLELMQQAVIANATGKNLTKAHGISIYFPDQKIHASYAKTTFAKSNQWLNFLAKYLALQR